MVLQVYSTNEPDKGNLSISLIGTNGYYTYNSDFTIDVLVNPCYYAVVTSSPILPMSYVISH